MSKKINHSMSLAQPDKSNLSSKQKIALSLGAIGLLILTLALLNIDFPNKSIFLYASLGLITIGTAIYSRDIYLNGRTPS